MASPRVSHPEREHGRWRKLYVSVLKSETVNDLSERAELFYLRLILAANDYGVFPGRPQDVVGEVMPCRRAWTNKVAQLVLAELEAAQLIAFFTSDGKSFGYLMGHIQRQAAPNGKPSVKKVKPPHVDPSSAWTSEWATTDARVVEKVPAQWLPMGNQTAGCPSVATPSYAKTEDRREEREEKIGVVESSKPQPGATPPAKPPPPPGEISDPPAQKSESPPAAPASLRPSGAQFLPRAADVAQRIRAAAESAWGRTLPSPSPKTVTRFGLDAARLRIAGEPLVATGIESLAAIWLDGWADEQRESGNLPPDHDWLGWLTSDLPKLAEEKWFRPGKRVARQAHGPPRAFSDPFADRPSDPAYADYDASG